MKGLIIKDILNLKKQAKIMIVLLVVYLLISIKAADSDFFGGVVMMISAMLPITALSYDERAKWDSYALSMPVSRKQMVASKYILSIIFCFLAFVLNIIYKFIFSSQTASEIFVIAGAFIVIGLFYTALLMPFVFYFGTEKARFILMIFLAIPMVLVTIFANSNMAMDETKLIEILLYVLPALSVLMFIVSFFISVKIYENKEF